MVFRLSVLAQAEPAVIEGVCTPEYGVNDTWVYLLLDQDNDRFIVDSCLVRDNRFRMEIDVPYEQAYTLFAPHAKTASRLYDFVMAPADRLRLRLPDKESVRMNALAVPESYASMAYYNFYRGLDSMDKLYFAWLDSLARVGSDSVRYREYEARLNELAGQRKAYPMRLVRDPRFNRSPWMAYMARLLLQRDMPDEDYQKLLQELQLRFPDYPPIQNRKSLPPQSEKSKKDTRRIRQLMDKKLKRTR